MIGKKRRSVSSTSTPDDHYEKLSFWSTVKSQTPISFPGKENIPLSSPPRKRIGEVSETFYQTKVDCSPNFNIPSTPISTSGNTGLSNEWLDSSFSSSLDELDSVILGNSTYTCSSPSQLKSFDQCYDDHVSVQSHSIESRLLPSPSFSDRNEQRHGKNVDGNDDEDEDEEVLHRWPTISEAVEEMRAIGKISGPTTATGLLLYSRAMISMLFLGYLGELELAGGSLSIGFANITGYSVISGLAMGMEPICGQAYGAKQMKLLGLTLQRTVLLLLSSSVPIAFMWLKMKRILLWCGQDEEISSVAQQFILFTIPDLFFLSLLHPLRIYLRTQNITLPLTYCTGISVLLHVPLNFLLVVHLKMGIVGVAIAMIWTNLNLCLFLSSFIYFSQVYRDSWIAPSMDCLRGWSSLLALAIPTCASVCLEWWWYEFMIMLCGLLANPRATIASMGILIQTTSLVYVFPSSLSLGVSTRVGNLLGAHRPGKARVSMIVSLACAVVLGLCAMLFTTLMRHQWGRFFTNDEEILHLTAVALPIVGLCELGNCPQTTGCGVLRGSARPTIGANINLGSFYLVGMPVAIFFGFVLKLGFAGLWFGLLAAQGSCALLMLYVLCKTDWRVQAERATDLTNNNCCSATQSATILPISYSQITKPVVPNSSHETYPLLVA